MKAREITKNTIVFDIDSVEDENWVKSYLEDADIRNTDTFNKVKEEIFSLPVNERFHFIWGLLYVYSMNNESDFNKAVEKMLAQKEFIIFRDLLMGLIDLDPNNIEDEEFEKIKEFEKTHNVTVIIKDENENGVFTINTDKSNIEYDMLMNTWKVKI